MADPLVHDKPSPEPSHSRPTNKRQLDEIEEESDGVAPRRTKRTNSSTSGEEESGDDGNEAGGLSERDERDGAERRHAQESPPKGKKRLNSTALVKVEEEEYEKIPRPRPNNGDLPQELTAGDLWTKKILPNFIRWFAAQKHPWTPAIEDIPNIQNALQLICRHFVGDEYQLPEETSSPEFQVMLQRLSDAWRNPMKSAALLCLNKFFDSNKEIFGEGDTERKKWALKALDKQRFIYGVVQTVKVRGNKELVLDKLFQNKLILHTFAAHFNAVKKSSSIGGLPYKKDELPRGALALATAAVEWSLSLWTKGYITVKKLRLAEAKVSKSRNLTIPFTPKKTNRGTESKFHTAFGSGAWNLKTLSFLESTNALSREQMQVIMDLSRDILRASESFSDEMDEANDDPRAHLQERTFNDSEIEAICSDDDDMPGWDPIPTPESQETHAPEPGPSTASGSSKNKSRV